jgi:putative OPT family oligopeptide transporter
MERGDRRGVAGLGPRSAPRLTVRAVATGMLLGGLLSLCNLYSGLKIGFTVNMSIATALLGYGLWEVFARTGRRSFGLQENLINQTAGSAAASIAGAGLVAPIPALTLLTGRELAWGWLAAWTFGVSLLGVLVGLGMRRQLIETQQLPFPYGIATAELLREMYARGGEAAKRLRVLLGSSGLAAAVKLLVEWVPIPILALPGRTALAGAAAQRGLAAASLRNLGFAVDPSLLMMGVGALVGFRAGASMLGGAVLAWGVLAPRLLRLGWVDAAGLDPGRVWFTELAGWLLWPGVALMVASALTASLGGSVRALLRGRAATRGGGAARAPGEGAGTRWWFAGAFLVAGGFAIALQALLFEIRWHAAVAAVVLSFLLAIIAGRVTGETGIAPIGAMGKVTQLVFALLVPGDATANLMSANVTGGSASQCSDMLHDLKTGQLLDASPVQQGVAQVFGVFAGSLAGAAGYLVLIPDPHRDLMTAKWPAPAVAQWKAVAEVLATGVALPPGALTAMVLGAGVGVVLALLELGLPTRLARLVPSAPSLGLAFVLPAYYSMSVFFGATLALVATRVAPQKLGRFAGVAAAGVVAGESLVGVGLAVSRMVAGV